MNTFNEDIEYEKSQFEKLNEKYFKFFKGISHIGRIKNIEEQKKGIDLYVYFHDNTQLSIDEKIRRKDYGDFLVEEFSNYDTKKSGWLSHTKTQAITYYCSDTDYFIVLPFTLFALAFHTLKRKYEHTRKFAKNSSYRTSFLTIPRQEMILTMKDISRSLEV